MVAAAPEERVLDGCGTGTVAEVFVDEALAEEEPEPEADALALADTEADTELGAEACGTATETSTTTETVTTAGPGLGAAVGVTGLFTGLGGVTVLVAELELPLCVAELDDELCVLSETELLSETLDNGRALGGNYAP
jgi:hypothetical protein